MTDGENSRMLTGITPNLRLAEVLERWPETAAVLARAGIDTRSSGEKRLEALARTHNLNLDQLLLELREAGE